METRTDPLFGVTLVNCPPLTPHTPLTPVHPIL